jgi:hypothetical protein
MFFLRHNPADYVSGIGFTEPYLRVFTNAAEQAAWDLRHEYDLLLNTTPDALARQVATWSLFGDLASKRIGYEAQYVSTAFVARDMLRITEAHGYSKLSYWGFSYGSVVSAFDKFVECIGSNLLTGSNSAGHHVCGHVPGQG